MNLKFKYIITVLLFFNTIKSQEKENIPDIKAHIARIDSIINNTDFFSINYKYLDENFRIKIDSKTFNNAITKYRFYPERIKGYKDSLDVVLMLQFNDYDKTRIAKIRLGFSWLRLGYHTWQTQDEADDFAQSFGITHPWKMYEFLIDESNIDPRIDCFYTDLKGKLTQNNLSDFEELNRKKLLSFAMKNNPQRITDWQKLQAERKKQREAYQKEHGEVDPSKLGVGCGKENCCQ